MHFSMTDEGNYRICAGAVRALHGDGFVAVVVIERVQGSGGQGREAYRDETLAGGHRWPSPEAARLYAVAKAREVIRMERHLLAC